MLLHQDQLHVDVVTLQHVELLQTVELFQTVELADQPHFDQFEPHLQPHALPFHSKTHWFLVDVVV